MLGLPRVLTTEVTRTCAQKATLFSNMAMATKMFILVVKALTKPFANRIKVSKDPSVSAMCISVGQFANRATHRMNVLGMGYKVKEIKPLPEAQAKKEGAEFVVEGVMLGVSGALLAYEYWRRDQIAAAKAVVQKQVDQDKREKEKEEIEARFNAQRKLIQELERKIDTLIETNGSRSRKDERGRWGLSWLFSA